MPAPPRCNHIIQALIPLKWTFALGLWRRSSRSRPPRPATQSAANGLGSGSLKSAAVRAQISRRPRVQPRDPCRLAGGSSRSPVVDGDVQATQRHRPAQLAPAVALPEVLAVDRLRLVRRQFADVGVFHHARGVGVLQNRR